MGVHDIKARSLEGDPIDLGSFAGKTLLVVNVASDCGFTPQYAGLQRLHERLGPRGFAVIGFPCNQFGEQEPGGAEEIVSFCQRNYGVTFPILEKGDVNGPDRHPLFEELTKAPNHKGEAGDVRWNFEKFLVTPDGEPVVRFSTKLEPEDPRVVDVIEQHLPA
ncbi:MAG TPA: glutathione peroxidase [Actinomycetota bacterium]